MTRSLDVTALVDAAAIPDDNPEFLVDTSVPMTERDVTQALRELGHRVRVFGVGDDVGGVVAELSAHRPDVVFNLTEQFRDDRWLDKNVVWLLEMMRIPFTGTGSAGLLLARDKGLCKQLLSFHRIRFPSFIVVPPGKNPRAPKRMCFPLVVKPTLEDGSDGISLASVVRDEGELRERVRFVHEHWHQVAIAEEYIEGRELYVGVLGNRRLKVLPPRELVFGERSAERPAIATSRVKSDAEYRRKWKIEYRFAELPVELDDRVARISKRVYRVLQIRDYARIDLRLTEAGAVHFLEANPNPDIASGEDFAEAAAKAGIPYNRLIDRLLRLALSQ